MNLRFTQTVSDTKKIPTISEKVNTRGGYVEYGTDNRFPNYILELYQESPLFSAIISTLTDFIFGDGIIVNDKPNNVCNRKNETIEEVTRKIIFDFSLFNGFALQLIRNSFGDIVEVNHINFEYLRINEEGTEVYYNDWGNTKNKKQMIKYERFNPNLKQPNSILYYRGNNTRTAYPLPSFIGALKALEISTQIGNFHLNQILNNFTPQLLVNFNNGIIPETEMEEIENAFNEKFQGTNNSGRIVFSFNNDAEHATTLERIADDGFDTKYSALKEQVENDIFVAFRINPILIGVNNSNSGFTKQEFSEAFTLFQRTVIQPIQQQLKRVLEQIFDKVEIKPFSIDWGEQHESGNIPTQEQTEKEIIN